MARQTIELAIPITMQDQNTGVERWATPDEVRIGVVTIGNSLTHWPDEGEPVAWWEDPGIVVFQKLRGTGIYYGNFYFMEVGQEYEVTINYVYDTSYQIHRKLYINDDGSWYWTL